MSWSSLFDLDPTRVCVVVLILAFSVLWIYVTIVRGKTEQPNLSVLYESPPKSSLSLAGKKGHKGKKQVSSSPRPSSKNAQKGSPISTASSSTLTAKSDAKGGNLKLKKEGVAGDDKTTKRVTKKNRSKGQKQVVKDKETKTRSQPDEENGTDPINNSEGWQTQLSRPQLRALKQKQRETERERNRPEKQSPEATSITNGHKPEDKRLPSDAANSKTSKKSRKERKAASRNKPPTPNSEETAHSRDSDASLAIDESGAGGKGGNSSSTPKLGLLASLPISEVETALREAAHSNLSSAEEDKMSGTQSPDTITDQNKPKQKRSRRKDMKVEESEATDQVDSQDDWVIV